TATFAQRRQLAELLIDRVIVTDGEVEIRYVLPTSPDGPHRPFCQLRKDHLDGVPLLVGPGVEGGRAAAGAAFVLAVTDLVCVLRNGAPDPAPPQVGPVGGRAVSLVTQHPGRPGPGPAAAWAGAADAPPHGLELRAVATLPRSDQDRQRFLALLAGQVHLGCQPAAGAAQAMIARLGVHPAGRLSLQIPLFRAPAACWCARATVESTL